MAKRNTPHQDRHNETRSQTNTGTKTPAPTEPAPGTLTDGLALWDRESGDSTPTEHSIIRIDANERLLIPFTTAMLRVNVHYIEYEAVQGYVHCNLPDCLLCRIGRSQDVRDLLPVYDVVNGAVGVLAISPNLRPHALRPQIGPILRRLAEGGSPELVAIRKPNRAQFVVSTSQMPDDVDHGATVIETFAQQLEAGSIDLASVYPRLTNADLAAIPEVSKTLKIKGIAGP